MRCSRVSTGGERAKARRPSSVRRRRASRCWRARPWRRTRSRHIGRTNSTCRPENSSPAAPKSAISCTGVTGITASRPKPSAVVTCDTRIGRTSWVPGRARHFAAVPRPSCSQLAIQFVTCRLEAMPSVKNRPGSAMVTIVNGRPREQHGRDERRRSSEPTGVSIATVVRHRNRSIARSTSEATTTVSGIRSRKSPQDSRLRSALMTAVPATADAATAGWVSSTRRTSETSCCRTTAGRRRSGVLLDQEGERVRRLRVDEEVAGERMAQQRVPKGRPLAVPRRARRRTDPGRRAAAPRGWSAR